MCKCFAHLRTPACRLGYRQSLAIGYCSGFEDKIDLRFTLICPHNVATPRFEPEVLHTLDVPRIKGILHFLNKKGFFEVRIPLTC